MTVKKKAVGTAKKSIDKVDKEYRLCNDMAPLSWIIKTGGKGNLLVFDEKEGVNRAIRHCRNEKSIFLDEQSEHAILDAVVIEKGYMRVPFNEPITQTFMDSHPDNEANGGHVFYEVNEEKEASNYLDREDLILDLKTEVRETLKQEAGIIKLQALVAVLKSSPAEAARMSNTELRREIFAAIDTNPTRFADDKGNPTLFDEDILRRSIALSALASDIIRTSADSRQIIWSKEKEVVTNIPSGIKPTDHLFEYLESDEGKLVLEEIQRRM